METESGKKTPTMAERGAETQFGAKNGNPRSQDLPDANKPWSRRSMLKYFSHVGLTWDDIRSKTEDELIGILLPDHKKCTTIQVGSAREHVRYAKSCADADRLGDQIDGKLIQTNLNAEYSALNNMSPEELREYRERLAERRRELELAAGGDQGSADRPVADSTTGSPGAIS